jgi:hypothetical protein
MIHAYDLQDDDVRSILIDVCEAIADVTEFAVSGFGEEVWPVDVSIDLPIFLEQLPVALRAIEEGEAAEINFYEQGLERSISLTPIDGAYLATCASRTSWQPNPTVESLDRSDLERMLLQTRDVFMEALMRVRPDLHNHPWIRQWLQGFPKSR